MHRTAWLWLLIACGGGAPASSPKPFAGDGVVGGSAPPARVEAPRAEPPPPPAAPPAAAGPVVCGLAPKVVGPNDAEIIGFGEAAGLEHPDALASVVNTVRATGELPDCYHTKREAELAGWSRGAPVWSALPGGAVGGDRFGNRENRLPKSARGYVEADLDDDGGPRGAARLVFEVGGARLWVTTDHYETFKPVPGSKP
jgi:ribonuclease T1